MVFFNYSTMQMAAKVVYYGPGLCGKTTNLQFIFDRTSSESRGEMVSLETETDRTLFFDLLPIDVGSVAGFDTRIQLYTVPGQVFYNTTRKLVLKGVDGVVFVADSQRAMLDANKDALKNLEENLSEMGLSVETVPVVLQYNKRDLHDICTIGELDEALNPHGWNSFESSAISGEGVFETLRGISKLTLLSLRKRLTQGAAAVAGEAASPPARSEQPAPAPVVEEPAPASPAEEDPEPRHQAPSLEAGGEVAARAPEAEPREVPAEAPPVETAPPVSPPETVQISDNALALPDKPGTPPAPEPLAVPPEARPRAKPVAPAPGTRRKIDVMHELERLRQQTMRPAAGAKKKTPSRSHTNGRGELNRSVELSLARADFERVRHFSLSLQVEDGQNQVVETLKDVQVDVGDPASFSKLLLKLNIALNPEE